jgi:alpha-glucosidase
LPYLYTAVEKLSRTGMPVLRPIFLEYPAVTKNASPFDLEASNEFLFGPDLLVAPPPFPEQPDRYPLKLPPGIWYDYWTGAKIQGTLKNEEAVKESLSIQPTLDVLPVYVREGAILPMQPLTQSTEETPAGDLILRVYPGNDCRGSLYMDDGKTFAYERGEMLRMEFSCTPTTSGVTLHIGNHEGSFRPWWNEIHLEVYGWDAKGAKVEKDKIDGPPFAIDGERHVLSVNVPDDGKGSDIDIQAAN